MKKLWLLILLCFIVKILQGQNDSTLNYTEPDSLLIKYDRIYKIFLEQSNVPVKHLFKFNIIGLSQVAPLFSYEQKIGKSFSSETAIGFGSASTQSELARNYGYERNTIFGSGYFVGGFEMIKYYHNLNRRQRLGKNINGFSGNYFAVQLGAIYIHSNNFFISTDESVIYQADVTYGIQRRIGNIGFIEPSVSVFFRQENGNSNVFPSLNLEMGFAIDSFSHLDKMFKE